MPATRGPQLRVSVLHSGDSAIVRLDGELDVATAEQLEKVLDELTATDPRPRLLVVDAEQLSFMDAAGLNPLLAAHRRLPTGSVRLYNARPAVARVLRLLDLADAFGLSG